MKKLVSIIILLAAAFALVTAAFSASDCVAVIKGTTARVGDEISLSVSIKNSPGIAAASFSIGYDSDVMTYIDSTGTNDRIFVDSSEEAGTNPVKLVFLEPTLNDVIGDFEVAKVNFKIANDAVPGTYDIDFSVDEAYNSEDDNYSVSVSAQSCTVVIKSSEPGPGDANCDGDVTIRDAAIILQHIAGWNVDINIGFADVDCNEQITIRDVALILQYIAGWEVILGEG